MDIKPIETEYNGYRFRSRLEARWAVFFDALKIKYQYEPEGYIGIDDTKYLPDFYFPHEGIYAEVKGSDESLKKDAYKITAAIDFNSTPISQGLIILGEIPNYENISFGNIPMFSYLYCCKGVRCEHVIFTGLPHPKIVYGNDEIVKRLFLYSLDCSDYYSSNGELPENASVNCEWTQNFRSYKEFPNLKSAYMAARQARFEHGEKPKF